MKPGTITHGQRCSPRAIANRQRELDIMTETLRAVEAGETISDTSRMKRTRRKPLVRTSNMLYQPRERDGAEYRMFRLLRVMARYIVGVPLPVAMRYGRLKAAPKPGSPALALLKVQRERDAALRELRTLKTQMDVLRADLHAQRVEAKAG